jgi:hypothetical protein
VHHGRAVAPGLFADVRPDVGSVSKIDAPAQSLHAPNNTG